MASPEHIASLKRQRATIKSSCTRIKTYVNSITSITPDVVAQIQERKTRLDEYWANYNAIQTQLECLCEETEESDRIQFENAFYDLSAKLRSIISVTITDRAGTAPSPSVSNQSHVQEPSAHIRLPKLNLPTFSGKYDDWYPFYNVFHSVIATNHSLNDTQRFQYLKASLSGEAADVIHSLELTDQNYAIAWELLRKRYDNKRIIVHSHIRAILELPTMLRENSLELRKIADGASKHIRALNSLKCPTDSWDDILVYILSAKLDSISAREWQSTLSGSELPSLKQLLDFVINKCQMLEATNRKSTVAATQVSTRSQTNTKRQASTHVATVGIKCNYCQGDHAIYYCKDFRNLSVEKRIAEVQKRKLCTNCLRTSNHSSGKCNSGSCKICNLKHNSLLHLQKETGKTVAIGDDGSSASASKSTIAAHSAVSLRSNCVMLSTALVHAYDSAGSQKACRVLLDSGSQANFISRKCLKMLKLKAQAFDVSVSGINRTATSATHIVSLKLQSRVNSFSTTINCIVTDRITDKLPAISMRRTDLKLPRHVKLADPHFYISSDIDILVGAELFWDLLCIGQIKSSENSALLQKTLFGWVLAGRVFNNSQVPSTVKNFHVSVESDHLQTQLQRFWCLEEIPGSPNSRSVHEQSCERHFTENVSRNEQGRFVVKLPVKQELLQTLGESRTIALRRFHNQEKRLNRDPNLALHYVKFMREYRDLGHMKLIDEKNDQKDSVNFYLPHHAVVKESSQTTKLRVVFDGSCRSSSGVSINDVLMIGPVIQQDLISILMRFRTFVYVFTADIVKMYRQILVHESQTRLQRILWRDDTSTDVDTYELTTVTYGTASASYLATRCLTYLAEQEASNFPVGWVHVLRDFYVDDILTGADSLDEARLIQGEVIALLKKGLFELSKWASNCNDLLEPTQDTNTRMVDFNKDSESRILGIRWNPANDSLHFFIKIDTTSDNVTKRTILSEISRLFDPLGLLGPVIIIAKLLIQELWQSNVSWDESVPARIHTQWSRLKEQLPRLNDLKISRLVKFNTNTQDIQIHGFCDASQRAYGACIYVRCKITDNSYHTELLCSKSRVAPLKALSLPRLELCAAVLLAQLFDKVRSSTELSHMNVFLWSDSTITLHWISSSSRKWSVFVANRVGEIQRLTRISDWHHISSKNNSADILSRGAEPSCLLNASIWWHGPEFLQEHETTWPKLEIETTDVNIPEERKFVLATTIVNDSSIDRLMQKFSNINKICRIVAYCRRFLNYRRTNAKTHDLSLSCNELSAALSSLCGCVQASAFPLELRLLASKKPLNASSSILSLSPFMDPGGIIRVGGRLRNSTLPYATRHPIILPKRHRLTQLIIESEHVRNLHAGVQTTIAAVRQRFWPLSIRSVARQIVRNCIVCFKVKPTFSEAKMGALPLSRVEPSRPFSHCGVDYAGPIIIREGRRRNARNVKAYVAIFVCFAVRAVHIELVGDLTSDAFLGALKRFISRRGNVIEIQSDNGTAFTGASRQLKEFYDFLSQETTQADIKEFLQNSAISWRFIPPNAPHFGGLWEAAVKSAKFHMHRIVGNAHLTFEEMQTVLCGIEAILNSRPITPLTEDPNDLACLTPGHFLIGDSLNSFPCTNLTDVPENRLSRWQRVEQIRQHYWKRWSVEYLTLLQERAKWKSNKGSQLEVGQLVLIKQQGLGPLQWLIGRIIETHPGSDGVARSATVKTSKGLFVRPLTKLAILPIET